MAEYIKKEDVLKEIESKAMWSRPYGELYEAVQYMLATDVAQGRHGRWIDAYPDIEPNPMFMYGICSECGFEQGISKYLKYCPDCGCRMDSVEE